MPDDDSPLDRVLGIRLQLPLDVHRFLLEHGDGLDETIAKVLDAYLEHHHRSDPQAN